MEIPLLVWIGSGVVLAVLFGLDLLAATKRNNEVSFKEAIVVTLLYTLGAIIWGLGIGIFAGWDFGSQYFAGYILERSLSVDNLFVFVVIFSAFAVPRLYQQQVLVLGIFGALLFRIVFIVVGAALLELFSFMFLLFGILLVWTAIQLYRHRNEDPDIEDNAVLRLAKKKLPFTDEYEGNKFSVLKEGKRYWTPMFLVLLALATTDVLFALDSIPAIFGVTQEVYIVILANAWALLGMRPLFFLVTGMLDRLVYLSHGLALILGFIGVKLALHWAHTVWTGVPEIPTFLSLGVILAILVISTVASLLRVKKHPEEKAHAGKVKLSVKKNKKTEEK